ncbi:MAG: hypothetical protein IJ930_00180, partial [Lachnospiraceae bacterium]|nr:hypothetical protein [Lachnospiraceae bacterium]
IRDAEKRLIIWLTRAESEDENMNESLRPIFREYAARKYLVAVFESGQESLEALTRDLVLYNRVRIHELEMASRVEKRG